MYSEKSVKKCVSLLKAATEEYMKKDIRSLKLHISKGNRKIGKVHNFSLAPIITCSNCGKCKNACYDVKACLQYKNVITARAENTAIAKKDLTFLFLAICAYLEKKKAHKFFRWHVSGDIFSLEYFMIMVEIARLFPDWTFWTYTKAFTIVNNYCNTYGKESIPKNMSVMFSAWPGLKMINPYNFPTFTCVPEGMNPPANAFKCPGNCDICKAARRGCPYNESAWTYEH